MTSYQIQLRETRLATDGTDDVALFDVVREDDCSTWRVPVFLSPLFRLVHMRPDASSESRRDMVAGLGVRAIIERLEKGLEPLAEEPIVLAKTYPGAPDDPDPLPSYEQVTVSVENSQ